MAEDPQYNVRNEEHQGNNTVTGSDRQFLQDDVLAHMVISLRLK